MLSTNDKLFHELIDYFYYLKELDLEKIDYLFNHYNMEETDCEGSNFIFDILIYTIKFKYKKTDLLDWILKKNININFKNNQNGYTILHIICENINKNNYEKSKEYIKMLINYGADPFIKNKNFISPIQIIYNLLKKMELEFNPEKDFNLLCFNKEKILLENQQKEKIINSLSKDFINDETKEIYKETINSIKNYIYYKNKNYIKLFEKKYEGIIYNDLIIFLKLLRKENLYFDNNNNIPFTIDNLLEYILPNTDYKFT
jgi:hypothetical protein